ncbi:predicted protein [Naegleria gruberi]|uniref:Predicted protein n=1 Tax=Naegleria gruberi TaxID=5762 RepID=D2VUR7_NAEGR|nr:uncharacterized protein NAEGRDRAFT_72759 [Naegleria gruberi]EFC39501.1 predicted protein [Naegleria gruberi]|eukprot:XP_002672245.1 predicted protein [Naegleria gruberi strain NEG-M]
MSIGVNKASNNTSSTTATSSSTIGKSGNAIKQQGSTNTSSTVSTKSTTSKSSLFEEDEEQIVDTKSNNNNQKKGQQHSSHAHFYAKLQQEKNNDKKPSMNIDVSSWGRDEEDESEQTNMIESGFSNIRNVVSSQSNNYPLNKSTSNQNEVTVEGESKKPEGSKYIAHLVKVAEDRKKEKELAQMRRVQKQAEANSATTSETQVFVTEEYKQYLKEQERWTEQKEKQLQDEINNDVTKKGMGNFYKNLLSTPNSSNASINMTPDSNNQQQQQSNVINKPYVSKVDEKKALEETINRNDEQELSSEKKRKRQDEDISTTATNKEDLIIAPISTNINKDEAKLSARERYLRRKAEKEKSIE